MTQPPPLFLSLEPILRCPNRRCRLVARGLSVDLLAITCLNKHCRTHWWATRLEAGDIRSQVRAQFDGNELFVELLDRLGAPERIDQPMYWQLWIDGSERHRFTDRTVSGNLLVRTHELIRKLVALPQRAP
jgi:hypothetical protein